MASSPSTVRRWTTAVAVFIVVRALRVIGWIIAHMPFMTDDDVERVYGWGLSFTVWMLEVGTGVKMDDEDSENS